MTQPEYPQWAPPAAAPHPFPPAAPAAPEVAAPQVAPQAPAPAVAAGPPVAPAAPPAPKLVPSADGEVDINALLAQVQALQARLASLGATTIPAPEPRFQTIGQLFRIIGQQTLSGDILHEYLTVVDRLDDQEQYPVPPAPAPPAPEAPAPVAGTPGFQQAVDQAVAAALAARQAPAAQ